MRVDAYLQSSNGIFKLCLLFKVRLISQVQLGQLLLIDLSNTQVHVQYTEIMIYYCSSHMKLQVSDQNQRVDLESPEGMEEALALLLCLELLG